MNFNSIRIQGFRSFTHEVEFEFGSTPGLYNLSGDNQLNPSLGGNGAGKSTIMEALAWVLYGKTSSGARAAGLKNWSGSEAVKVELDFLLNGESCTLIRTWNPNKIFLKDSNPRPVSQDELDDLLKQNFDSFLLTTLVSQNGQMFLDMKPSDKLKVFSDALNLSVWDTYSAAARKEASMRAAAVVEAQTNVTRTDATLQVLLDTDYTEDIKEWKNSEKATVADLDSRIAQSLSQISWHKGDIESYELSIKDLGSAPQALQSIPEKYTTRKAEATYKVDQIAAEIKKQQRHIKKLDSVATVCPSCGRAYDNAEEAARKNAEAIEALLSSISTEKASLRLAELRVTTTARAYKKQKDALHESRLAAEVVQESKNRFEKVIMEAQAGIKSETRAIAQCRNAKDTRPENPYATRQAKLKTKRDLAQDSLENTQKELIVCEGNYESSAYWIKGFKNIQLYLIDEALAHLELEVNSALDCLGLHGWKISFSVESETQSHTISKGFRVSITCPELEKPVPWETWSGGEKQRLKLAATLGMINLLLTNKGVGCNIEVYDEPTSGLSQQGIDDLLETLRSRATSLNKCIWIVDHHSLDFGGFVESVVVKKDKTGSFL